MKHKLKDKILLNELGAMIGKIIGTNAKANKIIVMTNFGSKISYSVDRIIEISPSNVIIR